MDCVPSLGYSENTLPRSWHSRSSFPACPAAAPQPAPHNVVPLAQAVALAGRQPLPLLPQSQAGVCEAECNNAIDHGYSTGVPMGPPLAPSPMEVVYFSPTPTSIGAPMVSPAITTITYGCVQQKTTPILTTSTSNTYEEQQPTFFSPMIETTPAYHLPPPQELSYMQNYSVQQPQQMQLQQKPSASLYQEAGYGVNASSSRPMCQQPCCMPSSPYSPPAPQYQLQPQQEQPYFQGRCSPGHEAVLQTACAGCSYAAPVLVGAAYSQASPQLQPCVSCIPQQQQFQQLQPVQACQPVSGVAEACCCGVGSPSAQLICTQPQQPVLLQQSFSMPMQHSQQQQPLQRSLSDGSAVSTVYTFGACEEGSSPALLAASRSGSSSQGGAAGYNSPLSSSEGPVMARGSSSPLEQCLQEGPCSIGEQVQPTDDVLAPEQPMLMQDAIEIEEKAVTKAPAPRRRPAPVTHIVGIGGLLCLPPKKTKSTTAGTVQWYAGFRSPLGKEGRAELIKRMRVVHRNNREFCGKTLTDLGICFRRLAHATVEELWQLAYQWGLFEFALRAAKKSAHWIHHDRQRRSSPQKTKHTEESEAAEEQQDGDKDIPLPLGPMSPLENALEQIMYSEEDRIPAFEKSVEWMLACAAEPESES